MEKLILLAVAFTIVFSSVSYAAIIDMGDYQYDDATNLEWLDLSKTVNLSVDEAVNIYGSHNWALATASQFRGMYGYYDGGSTDGTIYGLTLPGSNDYYTVNADGYETAVIYSSDDLFLINNDFFADFGITLEQYQYSSSDGNDIWDRLSLGSIGFYGNYHPENNPNGVIQKGGLSLNFAQDAYASSANTAINYYDYWPAQAPRINGVGVFLVREAVSVPEPSIIVLLVTGFIGLGFARRRVKK